MRACRPPRLSAAGVEEATFVARLHSFPAPVGSHALLTCACSPIRARFACVQGESKLVMNRFAEERFAAAVVHLLDVGEGDPWNVGLLMRLRQEGLAASAASSLSSRVPARRRHSQRAAAGSASPLPVARWAAQRRQQAHARRQRPARSRAAGRIQGVCAMLCHLRRPGRRLPKGRACMLHLMGSQSFWDMTRLTT